MRLLLLFACWLGWVGATVIAAEPPAATKPAVPAAGESKPAEIAPTPPPLKITPGKVIVPTDRMRRIWGELISIDPQTRTGKFRNEGDDEVMAFTIMPYAELLHHAALGDVQDYRVGERAIFRLHENEAGEWVWLTYIQDELNFLNGHKEYYWVDAIDAAKGTLTITQANLDKTFVRQKDIVLETDANTRYWKDGKAVTFADIKVGDGLRTKTHGTGKGKSRVCWEVFLDDESVRQFQSEQLAVHAKRLSEEGLPGYVDSAAENVVHLTLFPEGRTALKGVKPGTKVRLAPAGTDRTPTAPPRVGTITAFQQSKGNTHTVTVTLPDGSAGFAPAGLFRLWFEN